MLRWEERKPTSNWIWDGYIGSRNKFHPGIKKALLIICACGCGKRFETDRPNRKYFSKKCGNRARQEKHLGDSIEEIHREFGLVCAKFFTIDSAKTAAESAFKKWLDEAGLMVRPEWPGKVKGS